VFWAELSLFVKSGWVLITPRKFLESWAFWVCGISVTVTMISRTISEFMMRVITTPVSSVSITRPVGASFNSVIVITWVLWAVLAISINSLRSNGTGMIRTTKHGGIIRAHMIWAVEVRSIIGVEVFFPWSMETETVVTGWISDTRTTRFNDSLGFSCCTNINWWFYRWFSSSSTFGKMMIPCERTINWLITIWMISILRKRTISFW
jgi:hypothetical protein